MAMSAIRRMVVPSNNRPAAHAQSRNGCAPGVSSQLGGDGRRAGHARLPKEKGPTSRRALPVRLVVRCEPRCGYPAALFSPAAAASSSAWSVRSQVKLFSVRPKWP